MWVKTNSETLVVSISSNQENKRNSVVLLFFIGVTLVSPWLVLVLMGILVRGILSERIGRPALAIALVGFLALFNATKRHEGDWYWYVNGYLEMQRIGLLDYLQSGELSIRVSEPLYYAFSFALSRLSGGNFFVLALAVSLAVYLTYIFALEKLVKCYGLHRWSAAICIVFAMLAGVTFTQSLSAVRQYIAGSLLFFFFVLILERRYKAAVILFVLGALAHNSFIIPGSLLGICAYLWSLPFVRRCFLGVVFILVSSGYVIGSQCASLVIGSAYEVSALLDNGEVTFAALLMDLLLFFISVAGVVFFGKSSGFHARASAISVLFLAMFGGLLVGGRELTLFLLRFYFYVEWFRIIGVITIVWFLVCRAKLTKLAFLIIPLSFLMLGMRVAKSPFDYGGGFIDHLFGSFIWWIDNLSEVPY
jgi:hypothetical protein